MIHRTKITEDKIFVLQLLRKQLGQKRIFPIHRLDRGTSGVLVFGKSSEVASQLSEQFRKQQVRKVYHAIIRGYIDEKGVVDYPIAREKWLEKKEAITHYKRLNQSEVPFAIGRYPQSRYTLVEARPKSGRRHQIRRHFSHLRHPVIGDKKHGDIHHNKYFKEVLGINRMLLHAKEISFTHPVSQDLLLLIAEEDTLFSKAKELLKFIDD